MSTGADVTREREVGLHAATWSVPDLLGLPGQPVAISFRGRSCVVVAEPRAESLKLGAPGLRQPITDPVNLELISGSGEQASWAYPVHLHAVVESGNNAVRIVQRVSRWASYAARVAVVPASRLTEVARLEAELRGVWLVSAGNPNRIAVPGERGPVAGAVHGLLHRLLHEVVAEALQARADASADVRSATS
ncbi:MAG: hypothetical protein LC799_17130 [Actinobacteria bacterium]|nr:hypothetical protein [Actinomycetota bacterium]